MTIEEIQESTEFQTLIAECTAYDYKESLEEKKPSKGTVQNDLLLMIKLGLSEKYGDGPSSKYKIK